MTTNKLKERLDKGPVICAEGFLFEIERRQFVFRKAWFGGNWLEFVTLN